MIINCKYCNHNYDITDKTLLDERIEMTKGERRAILRLIYFQCPNCGEIKPAMLDDKKSLYYAKRKLEAKTESVKRKHEERFANVRKKLIDEWQGGSFELAGVIHTFELNPDEEIKHQ